MSDKRHSWEQEYHEQDIYYRILGCRELLTNASSYLEHNLTRKSCYGALDLRQVKESIPNATEDFDKLISALQHLKRETIEILKHHSLTSVEPDTHSGVESLAQEASAG